MGVSLQTMALPLSHGLPGMYVCMCVQVALSSIAPPRCLPALIWCTRAGDTGSWSVNGWGGFSERCEGLGMRCKRADECHCRC